MFGYKLVKEEVLSSFEVRLKTINDDILLVENENAILKSKNLFLENENAELNREITRLKSEILILQEPKVEENDVNLKKTKRKKVVSKISSSIDGSKTRRRKVKKEE